MSWVSRRQTTKKEDTAYCLLGLFDVNMPLLYGEGDKAFMRLQHELLKNSDDESIFAWTANVESSGLLATSPAWFYPYCDCDCDAMDSVNKLKPTEYISGPTHSGQGVSPLMRVISQGGTRLFERGAGPRGDEQFGHPDTRT
jgi:hypothetical protein